MPASKKGATNELSLKGITQKLNKEELIKRLTVRIIVDMVVLLECLA